MAVKSKCKALIRPHWSNVFPVEKDRCFGWWSTRPRSIYHRSCIGVDKESRRYSKRRQIINEAYCSHAWIARVCPEEPTHLMAMSSAYIDIRSSRLVLQGSALWRVAITMFKSKELKKLSWGTPRITTRDGLVKPHALTDGILSFRKYGRKPRVVIGYLQGEPV